ncbi:hypothetical protein GDO78_022152 [Eleutherodactylus coqui]|uniref:Uncharacterized protein n=1 Tax=Eleutherodactylus coqui TaxID=57060 RepID=A0A8J6C1U3_ELECQ|nr:hypothetical protein GDO78_022152 [Eleutherodactylus coqui]
MAGCQGINSCLVLCSVQNWDWTCGIPMLAAYFTGIQRINGIREWSPVHVPLQLHLEVSLQKTSSLFVRPSKFCHFGRASPRINCRKSSELCEACAGTGYNVPFNYHSISDA